MINFARERAAGYKPILLLPLVWFLSSGAMAAQTPRRTGTPDALHQLNDSVEALVQRVSPSVVQILVTGYSSTQQQDRGQTNLVIGKERAIGSGVIVDPEGYIVTNAHVLNGRRRSR